jgi:hypothetical protein
MVLLLCRAASLRLGRVFLPSCFPPFRPRVRRPTYLCAAHGRGLKVEFIKSLEGCDCLLPIAEGESFCNLTSSGSLNISSNESERDALKLLFTRVNGPVPHVLIDALCLREPKLACFAGGSVYCGLSDAKADSPDATYDMHY